jgi:hypothetical protein
MRTITQNGRPIKSGRTKTRDARVRTVSAEKQLAQLEWRAKALTGTKVLTDKQRAELDRTFRLLDRHTCTSTS